MPNESGEQFKEIARELSYCLDKMPIDISHLQIMAYNIALDMAHQVRLDTIEEMMGLLPEQRPMIHRFEPVESYEYNSCLSSVKELLVKMRGV